MPREVSSPKLHTIMIIDDELKIIEELKELLCEEYNTITASSGKEALDYLKNMKNPESISLVISDQRMPGMTGTELFKLIKERGYIPDAVRIILTAHFEISIIIEAINDADINQYILKPFNLDNEELFAKIKMAIKVYEKQKSLKNAFRNTVFFDPLLANDICLIEREYNNWFEKRANASQPCLAVIMLNLDEFKNIHDAKEQKLTETILEQLGTLLLNRCRKSDISVRWNNNQLMIIGRFISREEAPQIARQIHEEILQKKRGLEQKEQISLQFSIGFSVYPPFPQKPQQIPWENVVSIANEAIKIAGPNAWAGLVPSGQATPHDLLDPQLTIRELIDKKILLVHLHTDDLKRVEA